MQRAVATGIIFIFHLKNKMKKEPTAKEQATKEDQEKTYREFKDHVNMTVSELEKWLATEESKHTGQDSGDGEAIGHKSGKEIIDILRKKKDAFTDDDYHQMHRVISYISRHKAQKPKGDVKDTKWNYSLKNWGYDYSKQK